MAVESEPIPRWFCACEAYVDDPGMVVCWKCEQPLVECDDALIANLLQVGIRTYLGLAKLDDDLRGWIVGKAVSIQSLARFAHACRYGDVTGGQDAP